MFREVLRACGKDVSAPKLAETPCTDDHQINPEDFKSTGEQAIVFAQIARKYLYLARIGSPDFVWTVNMLARSVTEWDTACAKRLTR